LLEESYPALEKLFGILRENPDMKIELAGHTDALGSLKAKERLSFERVEKIKEYLTQLGIDQKRIITVGYGGSRPIAPNDNEENRAKTDASKLRYWISEPNTSSPEFDTILR
jgi:OOP family OmpA-OmpF porin